MNEAIIIGWVNYGKAAVCGETMKNQLMIRKLEDHGITCHIMDFYKWRRHPWVFLQLLVALLVHKDATLIFSTSVQNVYPMMRLMYMIGWKQHTIHWVIGGSLGQKTVNGFFDASVINYIDYTLVESDLMVEQLNNCGVNNVIRVPNFKPIPYMPNINDRSNKLMKFVFLSRIMPEKGCDYILQSVKILNSKGLTRRYEVDFYGKIADSYEEIFKKKISELSNVHYCGFLNLIGEKGYDILSTYDIMLFPTYWKGEGFAGVFIDAFIAGVPILATDWAHNKQFLKENETALFIPVHNVLALSEKMEECIMGKYDLKHMAKNCQREAQKYDVNNVITKELLIRIGLLCIE